MGASYSEELPGFEPPHPGDYIRQDVLPSLGMTIKDLADHLGVNRATLSSLVNRKSDLSIEMAQRLGMAFRNGTRFWVALQMQRDIWFAERENKIRVQPIKQQRGTVERRLGGAPHSPQDGIHRSPLDGSLLLSEDVRDEATTLRQQGEPPASSSTARWAPRCKRGAHLSFAGHSG